ncbi:MAG: biotin/lipoyl-binding protein [Myxococcaceae bacterium]|nr:MAG: biotin/lipoyl-binding protein [Myxococcaceae bacterium]
MVEPWGGEVRVAPNEQGQIAEVAVQEGDAVRPGQLLVRLEDAAQTHAAAAARAELAEAEAALLRVQRGATPDELALARADREVARTRSQQAARDAARARALSGVGGVPLVEAERTEADALGLTAALDAASARLSITRRGARPEDRDAARARVTAARARLRSAEGALDRRRIVAPKAGTVLWSRWHVGELFVPGATPILILGDVGRLQVRAEVDELDADAVAAGMPCEAFTDVGRRVAGCRVVRLSPAFGRRALAFEAPTSRTDVRVREVFVELTGAAGVAPGQRLWIHVAPGRG